MAVSVEWEIKGTEFANCNCACGCGCQFNALPDKGFCEAVAGYQIHQGNFGDVRLDGLRAAAMWRWPGAVHEGNGVMQIVIDEPPMRISAMPSRKSCPDRKPRTWPRCGGSSALCVRPSTTRCFVRSTLTLMSMRAEPGLKSPASCGRSVNRFAIP